MFQINKPNYTQAPNQLFDEWLPLLGMAELKVLMVILRKTFGWHKVRDRISLTQLETITGLQRRHVLKGVKGLVEKNLIIKTVEGKKGFQQTFYDLVITEDSNNFTQCPKDTPPSVLKTPTKETLPKETLSPIVPKGDVSPRKSKREEKLERADRVWTTPLQDLDLERRCSERGLTVSQCYDRLSTWKIGKSIEGGKNDYATIINWVMDAEEKDKKSISNQSKDLELAQKVIARFPRQVQQNEIQLREKGILFSYGHVNEFIEFQKFGFRDKLTARLLKMNQSVEGL